MEFLADFTAIDFETANNRRDSACQLAAVVVRGGSIVDQRMWMIRPDPFFFSPGNIRIHGITPEQVADEADFGECWEDIKTFLAGDFLVAHNAPFDLGVLLGCLRRHHLEIPELRFSCTRLIAKQTWPERQRFGLKPLANWLGVDFRHHDALEDSIACARILLAAGIAKNAKSLTELEAMLQIHSGKAGRWGIEHAAAKGRGRKRRRSQSVQKGVAKRVLRKSRAASHLSNAAFNPFDEAAMLRESGATWRKPPEGSPSLDAELQRLAIRAEFIQPLRGKQIVVVGKFRRMNREQLIELASRSGGKVQQEIDESTNCLLLGSETDGGTKYDSANDRPIEILSENEFLTLVGLR